MHRLFKPAVAVILVIGILAAVNYSPSPKKNTPSPQKDPAIFSPEKKSNQKIQVALLLDVSNSMDGLIEQAKAQLWNMVSVMGRAQCGGATPQIEIALYEYGRPTNPVSTGYVKQINAFTRDLDQVSRNLFGLVTNGGEEYCGHVMYSSLNQLNWDTSSLSYKVIFIAGNEDFYQGDVPYTKACTEATKKGIIVNTIYCGSRTAGIREHWNMGSECGSGSFTNINQDAKPEDIATPYDSALFRLNDKLNTTYISYGYHGKESLAKQAEVDQMNYKMNKSIAVKRVEVKGKAGLYDNSEWDLVDASTRDNKVVSKLDMKTLPDSLQTKTRGEVEELVTAKSKERRLVQQEIAMTTAKRGMWLVAEKNKASSVNNAPTLEGEIEKIIREQAKRFGMAIQ